MLTREEKDILIKIDDNRVERVLIYAAEHRELYGEEIEILRQERDDCREILDKIYCQMVTCDNPDSPSPLKNWKIQLKSGVSCVYLEITQEEARMIWRESWGLN